MYALINMKSKQSFKFEHEKGYTPETKVPKYKVKAKKTVTKKEISYPMNETKEMPANVYSISTYSPLVVQMPSFASVKSIHKPTLQEIAGSIALPLSPALQQIASSIALPESPDFQQIASSMALPPSSAGSFPGIEPVPSPKSLPPSSAGSFPGVEQVPSPQSPLALPKKTKMNTPWGPLSPMINQGTTFTPFNNPIVNIPFVPNAFVPNALPFPGIG